GALDLHLMTLYNPLDQLYLDPVATRAERDRTFQVCSDCRICVRLCPSFRSLFEMVDAHPDGAHDVKVVADAEHARVVDECYQCRLCYVVCPYVPERGQAWVIDFPALMLRSLAIHHEQDKVSVSAKLLARTDLQGTVGSALAPVVNATNRAAPVRFLMEKITGISRDRRLPTFARTRFSKWFRGRRHGPAARGAPERSPVALFPTCMVEYQDTSIGKDLVAVYERNGIACELPEGEVCCGMPRLDAGDITKFRELAQRNVAVLAPAVREGRDVVVPQPT